VSSSGSASTRLYHTEWMLDGLAAKAHFHRQPIEPRLHCFQGRLRAPIVRSAAPCPSCIGPSARGCGTCCFRSAAVSCDPLRFVARVHQHGACILENNHQAMARSRGGSRARFTWSWALTACRVHLALTPVRCMTIGCVILQPEITISWSTNWRFSDSHPIRVWPRAN
jgi:hypothetical protein